MRRATCRQAGHHARRNTLVLGLVLPAGLIAKGSARLWETLEFDWRTIPVMHSAVTLDDLTAVLVRAAGLLANLHTGQWGTSF